MKVELDYWRIKADRYDDGFSFAVYILPELELMYYKYSSYSEMEIFFRFIVFIVRLRIVDEA